MAHLLSIAEATRLTRRALEACGTSAANASSVAFALIGAELAGQGGHGLRRLPAYAAQARSGKVDGKAVPHAARTRPGAIHVDAGYGFAYPALDLAIQELLAIAPAQGIAVAGIVHSHHAGVAGLTVERLAELGLVALMFTNSPAAMAPWGGSRALFGTNPIAFACPVEHKAPVVVDVSLAKVARGKIMAAAQKGEAIPQGWALDRDGQPTADAQAALAGTMLPLGDAKGTALAMMVELLCAGLTGANYASEQTSFFEADGAPPGTGQAVLAIDPDAFGGVRALARFGELAAAVGGSEGARIPGRRRQELRARYEREGIPVDPALIDEIKRISAA